MKITKSVAPEQTSSAPQSPAIQDTGAAGQQMLADMLFSAMLQASDEAAMPSASDAPTAVIDTNPASAPSNNPPKTADSDAVNSVILAQLNMAGVAEQKPTENKSPATNQPRPIP